ncbi:hypothetical protein [Mycolicibacterium lacusdiani]|uniref:hypothetical protein n=1 Tax=Mycolicibacterium lacusdiani TaxID=2895283 RepID=UPI001F3767AA|nr:hypothetical protein [Mycolicibacterium lacusdiani]
MSRLAPVRELTAAERVAELRAAMAFALARIDRDGSVTSCTGLSDDVEAALYRYARTRTRTPAALADVHAAAERRIAGQLGG